MTISSHPSPGIRHISLEAIFTFWYQQMQKRIKVSLSQQLGPSSQTYVSIGAATTISTLQATQ